MAQRTRIPDFELANPLYAGAVVSFFTVDTSGVKTTTLATLYVAATGVTVAANPQTLDSEGKFQAPVYIDAPVIASVDGVHVVDHDTGLIIPLGLFRGDWAPNTIYYPGEFVRDGAAGGNTLDIYAVQSIHQSGVWATDSVDATKLLRMINVGGASLGVSLPVAITNGGTGATNADDAQRNLGLVPFLRRSDRAMIDRHVFLSTYVT